MNLQEKFSGCLVGGKKPATANDIEAGKVKIFLQTRIFLGDIFESLIRSALGKNKNEMLAR